MRITNLMMSQDSISRMNLGQERVAYWRERATSGKANQYVSDNPANVSQAMQLRSALASNEAYLDTANVVDDWMAATEFSLGQLVDIAKRGITLTQEGISDTVGARERYYALGTEMEKLLQNAVDIANANHQNSYIFSGYQVNTQPFSLTSGSAGGVPTIDPYHGDNGLMRVDVGVATSIQINLDGNQLLNSGSGTLLPALRAAAEALKNNDRAGINSALDGLQASMETLQTARTGYGTSQRQISTSVSFLEKSKYEIKKLLNKKEDTDMAEAITMMRGQETALQSVIEVSQRAITALNLFDYLS